MGAVWRAGLCALSGGDRGRAVGLRNLPGQQQLQARQRSLLPVYPFCPCAAGSRSAPPPCIIRTAAAVCFLSLLSQQWSSLRCLLVMVETASWTHMKPYVTR